MDNQKVRQYLRKGELAVTLLESLGYRYAEPTGHPKREPHWVEPETFVSMEDARKEMQAVLDRFRKPEAPKCPVNVGDTFTVTDLPSGHFLHGYGSALKSKYKAIETRLIAEGTEASRNLKGFTGWTVSFDVELVFNKRRLWLPVSCIKVTADARF